MDFSSSAIAFRGPSFRAMVAAAATALAVLLTGCAGLPPMQDRPETYGSNLPPTRCSVARSFRHTGARLGESEKPCRLTATFAAEIARETNPDHAFF